MEATQATLYEGEKILAQALAVNLTQSEDPVAGSFTLPVRCSINLAAAHRLVLADGRSIAFTITQLSHYSGDVEFTQATVGEGLGAGG